MFYSSKPRKALNAQLIALIQSDIRTSQDAYCPIVQRPSHLQTSTDQVARTDGQFSV